MSWQKLRAAVVGVGHLGRFHAQKYQLIDGVELIGVCDANEAVAKAVGAELGVPYFLDAADLLGKVDLVTIAANTSSHFELGRLFLGHGVGVHVEKPITSFSAEAEQLCELAEKQGVVLQVGHVERFNPALQAVRQKLGRPLFLEVDRLAPFKPRSMDVDVVLDLMIHDLDVILSLVQSEPIDVRAVGAPVLTSKVDIANARIQFVSGAVANVTASRVSQKAQRKFRVFLKNQYVSLDFGTGEINSTVKLGEWKDGEIPLEFEAWSMDKGDALLEETKSFVAAVKKEQPVVVSGRDGLTALRLAEMIQQDIARNQLRTAEDFI